ESQVGLAHLFEARFTALIYTTNGKVETGHAQEGIPRRLRIPVIVNTKSGRSAVPSFWRKMRGGLRIGASPLLITSSISASLRSSQDFYSQQVKFCPSVHGPLQWDLLQKFTDHTRCCGVLQFVTTMEYGQNIFCNRSEFSAPTGSSIALHQLAD